MAVYSLSDYKLTLKPNSTTLASVFGEAITIGGQGKKIGSISINQSNAPFDMKTFKTGGYLFEKNLDRSGTVNINLSQLAEEIRIFKTLLNYYYGISNTDATDDAGFTITLSDRSNQIASCIDCLPTGSVPTQSFGGDAENQTWTFSTGQITWA